MRLPGLATSIIALFLIGRSARADERVVDYVEQLQERKYHDLAIEFLERNRSRPELAKTIGVLADYYIGNSLVAGAESVAELPKRAEQLKKARSHFGRFIQQHPKHERAAEAQMGQASVLVQQGRIALMQSDDPNNSSRRNQLLRDARASYDEARKSFADSRDRSRAEWKKFPASIPEEQKRLRDAKTLTQVRIMQAHIHLGEVEHELAQTHDAGSAEYRKALERAIAIFEEVRQQFRDRLGGQFARMWQGKCYEELGDLGKAEGVYKELMEHDAKDGDLLDLQRHVQFFQIIVLNKRGDHVLAAELARQWLQDNSKAGQSETRIGVQFEQARALLQQAEKSGVKSPEANRLASQAMDVLAAVARNESIYKQPAIVLKQKYKAMIGSGTAVVTFDQALAMADIAKDRNAWLEAAGLYSQALKLAKEGIEPDVLAFLRYKLGFAHFQNKNYYEAAVLGEYVARRQSNSQYAAPAAHLALESHARRFDEHSKRNESTVFEEECIARLADYVTKTWPVRPEADAARLLLGDLHLRFDRFEAAGKVFESVPDGSAQSAQLLARAGATFWRLYVVSATVPPEQRDSNQLNQTLLRARSNMTRSIAQYRKSLEQGAEVPVEMVEVAISLAESAIEAGEPTEAVRLMQEFVPKTQAQSNLKPLELRGLVVLLRGCINSKDLQAAEQTMKRIEATGKDLAQITRIYLDLGKQLQAEMERLKALGDQEKYRITRTSYVTFLEQMAARRDGQTFLTLQWTGEAFFGLEMYEQAGERFSQIIRRTLADPAFLDQTRPENRSALLQAKLRNVTALRKQKRYSEAWDEIRPLPAESNTAKDPMHVGPTTNLDIIVERGLVLEEWSALVPAKLKTAIDHWVYWGQQLEKLSPRPAQYWDVRLHLLRCLVARARKATDPKERDQSLRQAEQQMLVLIKTSAALGGPTYKSQFKAIQSELEKELGHSLDAAPRAETAPKSRGSSQ